MKDPMVKRIVNVVFTLVIGIPLGFLSSLLTIALLDRFGVALVAILSIPVDLVSYLVNFLLAYLVTAGLICREKPAMKQGILGTLCYMGVRFALSFASNILVALILPGFATHPTLNYLRTFAADIIAAFVAGLVCFRAPKPVPEYVPYGMPQVPYSAPQTPYGAPQAPYSVPQAPYAAPQAPYAAPQPPAEDPARNI